ncbi:PQQ-dependent sugar dehydrogenase [Rufibacter sp. XAAS-G3-1]|uniref:PQQ-dependent sugar dehydrogenase n=1 Tax=Rufibacter sp. XAAS-G3-1 TaxID=2729134 RepID=UPI0015E66F59|nr:PQQ-dependent sugar dehydrogenase [Rufibacter sp. XAAS-G3-1]
MSRSKEILFSMVVLATLGTACNHKGMPQDDPIQTPSGCSLETRQANAPEQKPAFAGQTRACAMTSTTAFTVDVLAKGLETPWAVEPLPNGSLLVTEKPGRLRLVSATGATGEPITGLPAVDARGQGGLLDVALSPDFASSRTIFWTFAEPRSGGNATSVARGVLSADGRSLRDVRVIFRALPTYNGTLHYGSRLAFGLDGMLYVTLGERSVPEIRPQAQRLNSHMGKVVRITPDGAPAPGNPFLGQAGALPEIWSVGHRNVQSAAFDAEGKLWIVEMGPQGGDELNLVEKGKNYGWPLVTYGEEYSGDPVPNAVTAKEGFEQPVYYWDPVIAPSGAQFYTGTAFPEWQGNLFIGGLKDKFLVRLKIENNKVTGEEHLLTDRNQRIRDVRQGPDGALYVVTDQANGELWKISPQR